MIELQALVVRQYDEGSPDRSYAHAIVAGIDKYPRKVGFYAAWNII